MKRNGLKYRTYIFFINFIPTILNIYLLSVLLYSVYIFSEIIRYFRHAMFLIYYLCNLLFIHLRVDSFRLLASLISPLIKKQEAMAAVAPLVEGPKFKKPVPTEPPLLAFDPAYLKRKQQLPEQIFHLKSGKQMAYFTEGKKEDPAVVCFPAAGFGKWKFVPREPIPGVYLVAIDDIGHGNSSPLEKCPVFSESVAEVQEILAALEIENFYVIGHSRGGCHALQIAAAMPERTLGCATLSSPITIKYPSFSKQDIKELDPYGLCKSFNSTGCFGWCIRAMYKNVYYYKDKKKDFGFTGHSAGGYKYYISKETGGAPKEMRKDHFFVTKFLDSELHGSNSKMGLLYEMMGVFQEWSFDIAKIQCPTFIYNGIKEEIPLSHAKMLNKLIPNSELVVFQEHGHCSIVMEFENIVGGLLQGKSVEGRYK